MGRTVGEYVPGVYVEPHRGEDPGDEREHAGVVEGEDSALDGRLLPVHPQGDRLSLGEHGETPDVLGDLRRIEPGDVARIQPAEMFGDETRVKVGEESGDLAG